MSTGTFIEWGFRDLIGGSRYHFRTTWDDAGGVFGNWFAVLEDLGGGETLVDTGVAPGTQCEDAQELQILADGNFITFLIDGAVKVSLPTPVSFLTNAFEWFNEATYDANDVGISAVQSNIDNVCNSEGRSCAVPTIIN
jgi:hypothetical protein